jgi:hypothetical protein
MKYHLTLALLMLSVICRAEDRGLLDAGEFVEVTTKPTLEIKLAKDIPGFERLLDRIAIEPLGGSPASFFVSGRVISGNTGSPVERISILVGQGIGEPRLAGLTNADGEFKFRLWIKEDHRDLEIQVQKDFLGYLYVGTSRQTLFIGQPGLTGPSVVRTDYRRYALKRLLELSKAKAPKQ